MQKKNARKPARQALIVLGMHRSGTSALSGVLAKLGARPPATLMPSTPDNPRGYWESSALMQFHDDVLESAGTRWSDWDRFNDEWMESPVARTFMDRLASLLEQEFGDAALFLVKDPRMCRLLPLWLKVLGEEGITPKVVIPIRHPFEVFSSLSARDDITRMRAQLIWLRHNLEAESGSRELVRCFVRYSDLLADWRSVASGISKALDLKWPNRSSATEAEIEAYLSSSLRHHVAPGELVAGSSPIDSWVAAAYQAIEVLMDGGDAAEAFRNLDQVGQEFDRTSAIYAPVLYETRSGLEQMVGESKQKLADISQELGDQSARHELLKQENQANYQLAMNHKAQLDDLREQYQNRENTHASQEARFETLQADLALQRQQREVAAQELDDRHRAEMADIGARLQADLTEQTHSHEAEVEKISAQHQRELADMGKGIQERDAAISELEGRHRTEMAELGIRLQEEVRDARASAQLADESAQERSAEIVMLTNRVFELEAQARAAAAGAREAENALKGHVSRLETDLLEADETSREMAGKLGNVSAQNRILQLEVEDLTSKLDNASAQNRILQLEMAALTRKLGNASAQSRSLQQEMETLAHLVDEYRTRLENIRAGGSWRLAGIARKAVGKAPMIPPAVEDERPDDQILRKSKLFDGTWYKQRYPDVSARKMDPVRHYLQYGAKEGRDPGPAFSTTGYRARYPDVEEAGINPLVHYLKYGRKEGRIFSVLEGAIDNGTKRAAAD